MSALFSSTTSMPSVARADWQEDTEFCQACQCPFTFFRRRHHCRACGKCVCGVCSRNSLVLEGDDRAQRVCTPCVDQHIYNPPAPHPPAPRLLVILKELADRSPNLSRGDSSEQRSTSCLEEDMVEEMNRCEGYLSLIADALRQAKEQLENKGRGKDMQANAFAANSKLLAELEPMILGDLKKKAIAMGCDPNAVDGVDDKDNPKQAAIELILAVTQVEAHPGPNSTSCLDVDMVEAVGRYEACRSLIANALRQARDRLESTRRTDKDGPVGKNAGGDERDVEWWSDSDADISTKLAELVAKTSTQLDLRVPRAVRIGSNSSELPQSCEESLSHLANIIEQANAREVEAKQREEQMAMRLNQLVAAFGSERQKPPMLMRALSDTNSMDSCDTALSILESFVGRKERRASIVELLENDDAQERSDPTSIVDTD